MSNVIWYFHAFYSKPSDPIRFGITFEDSLELAMQIKKFCPKPYFNLKLSSTFEKNT